MSWESSIKHRAAKRAPEILIADKEKYRVSEMGLLCKQLGYKPRDLLRSQQIGDWYQWWYLPKKRERREQDRAQFKYSARREGLVPIGTNRKS